MRIRVLSCVLAAAAVASTGLLVASPASAAVPVGSCGSGYYKIDSYPVTRDWEGTGGHVDLYYNASTGKNCALTRPKASWAGKADNIWVCVRRHSDGPRDCDGLGLNDHYHYYAGPVYVSARHACIDVYGGLEPKRNANRPYNGGATKVHCG